MAQLLLHTRNAFSGHICKLCTSGRCLGFCSCKTGHTSNLLRPAWKFYTVCHQQNHSTGSWLSPRSVLGDKLGALWNPIKVPKNHGSQNGYMLQWQQYKSDYLKMASSQYRWSSHFLPGLNHDLRRFLEEVGWYIYTVIIIGLLLHGCPTIWETKNLSLKAKPYTLFDWQRLQQQLNMIHDLVGHSILLFRQYLENAKFSNLLEKQSCLRKASLLFFNIFLLLWQIIHVVELLLLLIIIS